MQIKIKRLKTIIVVLMLLIAGYFIYDYYILASNEQIIQLREELKIKEDKIKELKKVRKNKKAIENKIREYENELSKLTEKLPVHQGNQLVQEFFEDKNKNKIPIDDIKVVFSKNEKGYNVMKISVKTAKNLNVIKEVINYLNNYKRKISIKTFSMQAGVNDIYTATIDAELYYSEKD